MPHDGMPFDETTFDDALQRDIGGMGFSHPDAVYSDACHWEDGYLWPVDTVDGLVTALIKQRGWADRTAPSDISIDGYVGKAFQRTAPADMSNCTTRSYRTRTRAAGRRECPDFRSWGIRGDSTPIRTGPGRDLVVDLATWPHRPPSSDHRQGRTRPQVWPAVRCRRLIHRRGPTRLPRQVTLGVVALGRVVNPDLPEWHLSSPSAVPVIRLDLFDGLWSIMTDGRPSSLSPHTTDSKDMRSVPATIRRSSTVPHRLTLDGTHVAPPRGQRLRRWQTTRDCAPQLPFSTVTPGATVNRRPRRVEHH